MLMGSGTSMYPSQKSRPSSSGSYGARMINKLYGEEFNTYSETQKKFIKNNLGTIHTITQNTLTRNGYPEVAVRTRQQGTNIVSFYLHPNGDISDLKLKRHIGHQALDQNTLDVWGAVDARLARNVNPGDTQIYLTGFKVGSAPGTNDRIVSKTGDVFFGAHSYRNNFTFNNECLFLFLHIYSVACIWATGQEFLRTQALTCGQSIALFCRSLGS